MLSNSPIFASIPVKNLEESMEFYGKTLGLQMVDQNPNGVWYQTGNTRFAIYESEFAGTNQGTAAIIEVIEPESAVRSLKARGVIFEHYDLPNIKRDGDVHIFRKYKGAWFKDPSGNIISIGSHL